MSKKFRKEIVEIRREREKSSAVLSKAACLLKKLPKSKTKEQLLSLLRSYVINNGCSLLVTPENSIAPEHKLLIRDDCSGYISNLTTEHLSPEYASFLEKGIKNKSCHLEKYAEALDESVFQREMMQYPSYASVKYPLLLNLIQEKATPELIKKMNIADFRSFINTFCHDKFIEHHEKQNFVKHFINSNEQQFYDLLCNNGEYPAYVEALIHNMKTTGSAAAFELEYKGQTISGVGFDIDHKNPIYCPNDISSYADVNKPSSLNLVEINTHRLKHALERAVPNIDGNKMYEKIIMPQYCSAMLDFEHFCLYDFNNPQHIVTPSKSNIDNRIFLNKIETMVNSISLPKTKTQNKDMRRYINKNNGIKR